MVKEPSRATVNLFCIDVMHKNVYILLYFLNFFHGRKFSRCCCYTTYCYLTYCYLSLTNKVCNNETTEKIFPTQLLGIVFKSVSSHARRSGLPDP